MDSIENCLSGSCACSSAEARSFKRCKNCDYPIGPDGKTLVDHSCDDHNICPDCGGPLNERQIYGAL